jgi:hypothetical protein
MPFKKIIAVYSESHTNPFFFLLMALQPKSGLGLLFLGFLNHTQLDTHGRTPLDE